MRYTDCLSDADPDSMERRDAYHLLMIRPGVDEENLRPIGSGGQGVHARLHCRVVAMLACVIDNNSARRWRCTVPGVSVVWC